MVSKLSQTEQICTYTYEHDCIHVFRVIKPTRQVVDFYADKLEELFKTHPSNQSFLILADARQGMPSPVYAMQRARDLVRKNTMPRIMRAVYLHYDDPVLNTLNTFMSTFRVPTERLILKGDREDEAVEWLLSQARAHEFDK